MCYGLRKDHVVYSGNPPATVMGTPEASSTLALVPGVVPPAPSGTVKTLLILMNPGVASLTKIAAYGGSAPPEEFELSDITEKRVKSGVVSVPAAFS